jgi:hypothetical protein
MCSGSIEQHDLDQLDRELKEQQALDKYINNYKISFSTFSLLVPVLSD